MLCATGLGAAVFVICTSAFEVDPTVTFAVALLFAEFGSVAVTELVETEAVSEITVPDGVLELAALLNVKFKKGAQGQFLHSNVLTLLNTEGEIVCQDLGLTSDHGEIIRRASELASK